MQTVSSSDIRESFCVLWPATVVATDDLPEAGVASSKSEYILLQISNLGFDLVDCTNELGHWPATTVAGHRTLLKCRAIACRVWI